MEFEKRYKKLNEHQKSAVDTIEGPLMVIAGPGTGKTELLSMRVANILQKTDTLPQNILCLTFTDSGAAAMRERLATIVGTDAYKVAIHTFHSFGSEVINQNGDFFYNNADFQPADELTSHKLITNILDELDYDNPLATKMNGNYVHTSSIISSISDLKRSGLTSDELLQILDDNEVVMDAIEPDLTTVFSHRISATTLAQLVPVAHTAANLPLKPLPGSTTPLANVLSLSLAHAVDAATETDSTKPITAWKNHWLKKNEAGDTVFKMREQLKKLRSLSYIYFQYLSKMQEAQLYDYDDMILRVVHAMEVFDELRFNLQEKYQYIMVDEFQDTNLAQMRILDNLTNNPILEGKPNIMVVGDDDQAIYSFQGADISNILQFQQRYDEAKRVVLTDNYRSVQPVLDTARTLIQKGAERLEHIDPTLEKSLTSHSNIAIKNAVSLYEFDTIAAERRWLAQTIRQEITNGTSPESIAVLARKHSEIISLLPYFAAESIPVNYERQEDALKNEAVSQLIKLVRCIVMLGKGELDAVNALLPELLSHPMWKLSAKTLWDISLMAYKNKQLWLETIETHEDTKLLFQWLIRASQLQYSTPLEYMLDQLIGKDQQDDEAFTSPFFAYFFSDERLTAHPNEYIDYLDALRTIRNKLREYQPEETPMLAHFLEFIDLHTELDAPIPVFRTVTAGEGAIHLMTAHKSKGLEFEHVYLFDAVDAIWGEKARGRGRTISYPENLPIAPAGDSAEERLRLFFVAATRAKQSLTITYAKLNDTGKSTLIMGALADDAIPEPQRIADGETPAVTTQDVEAPWYERLVAPSTDLKDILHDTLHTFKLSATALNNFIDVTSGGPRYFLLQNLLHFPQAPNPHAAYGTAVHFALQRAHTHLTATNQMKPTEDILHDFEQKLLSLRLPETDQEMFLQKGTDALQQYIAQNGDTFQPGQKAELGFSHQQATLGEAVLTGNLDLVTLNTSEKTMAIVDYKTGRPPKNWKGKDVYEQVKLHKYKQQLMFYEILVASSRDYHDYKVTSSALQFVEPTPSGELVCLEAAYTTGELERFKLLVQAVWKKISCLELPDITTYEPSLKGILAFEQDLIDII